MTWMNGNNGIPNRNQQERNQLHAVQNIHKNLSHLKNALVILCCKMIQSVSICYPSYMLKCLWREFIAALRLGAQFQALPPLCHQWYIPKVLAPISRFVQIQLQDIWNANCSWHGPGMTTNGPWWFYEYPMLQLLLYGLRSTQVVFAISETT